MDTWDSKGAIFVILKNHANPLVRKKRLNPANKAKREASRNKFVEESGVPDRVKSFRKVDSSKDCPRARIGFVKLI